MRPWLFIVMLASAGAGGVFHPQDAVRKDWIDADTGHRVVRLTDDAGGSTLYFHDNAFSPDGDAMIVNTPNGIAVIDVAKIGTSEARAGIVAPRARGAYFGRHTREIYFTGGGNPAVTALNIDTRRTREVTYARGLINSDETLSVVKNAAAADPDGQYPRPPVRAVVPQLQRMFPGRRMEDLTPDQRYSVTKEDGLAARALNPPLQSFVFTSLKTGEQRETGFQYGDLNHMQFNPVDPGLLLYCHEGTWHELDRTWSIRADGSQMRLMHRRTMDMEINGHEWWSWNGRTVWFDLQTPRSQDFWIAGVNMATGKSIRYHVLRDWWGVHFNSSRDDTLFASDGGDASQVAYATDGRWINLLRVGPNDTLAREKLVNMSAHNYVTGRDGVEPNVHITPDKKWVVFTGQFAPGQRHVYAVEIEKAGPQHTAKEPPREWIDPDTGHHVVRLSDEPGSQSLYFHQNGYTADGTKLVITTPTGLATIDLKTRAIEKAIEGRVNLIMTGRKTGQAYYVRMGTVYAVNLDTKVSREIAKLPPRASIATVNADETLLAGTITEGTLPAAPEAQGRDSYPGKGSMMEQRLAARLPMQMFVLSVKTGEVKTILRSTDWLNHLQFSPTDPALLLFCHEGPWHKVDRTWTIRADGTGLTQIHHRSMNMEIEGHEFFSGDGRQIWYDLQTPRSEVFWLAGYDLATGGRTWYHLERSEWSVHFNMSPDGTLFAGDGGGPSSVAAPGNGQWIYLFRPQLVPDRTDNALRNSKDLIQPGVLKAEKLVNLARHDYSLEPNVTFTPDMQWIVFRSNMFGPTHVFAVELKKVGRAP
jgi:oligogalacturonide lyase